MMGFGGSGSSTDDSDDEEETERTPSNNTTIDDFTSEEESTGATPGGTSGGGIGGVITGGGPGGGGKPKEPTDEPEEVPVDETDSKPENGPGEDSPSVVEEPPDDSEGDEDDDQDEEPQLGELTVATDAWDAVGWGIEPVLKRLEVEFGITFDLSYEILSPRELDVADHEGAAERYEMPYASPDHLPENTRLSTEVLAVAQDQDPNLFRDYLHRLRITSLVEGRNIEDKDLLLDIAEEVGLDVEQLRSDWANVDGEEIAEYDKTPRMQWAAGDLEGFWSGNLEYQLAYHVLLDNNVLPIGPPLTPTEFVAEYEPVTTVETSEVLGLEPTQLSEMETIQRTEIGCGEFWTTSSTYNSDVGR